MEWLISDTSCTMLKSCPYFLRGRFRHSLSVTLQERCRAKLVGDTLGEERAWKAFGFVPFMLLHKPKGAGNVGGVDGTRFKFARGLTRALNGTKPVPCQGTQSGGGT